MSEATIPADPTDQIATVAARPVVALDGQQYDWRDAHDRVQTRIGYDEDEIVDALARWYIHTDRLEAERDALRLRIKEMSHMVDAGLQVSAERVIHGE